MDQKDREQWLIPIIIALATGLPLLILGIYLTAWATGAQLRPPFTLEWIRSLLSVSVQMPLWMILVVAAASLVVLLYFHQRAKKKSDRAPKPAAAETKSEEQKPPPSTQTPPTHPAFPADGADSVHRQIVRYIMFGQDQLLAYTTTRDNLPGTRFLVVRNRPDREPQSLQCPDREAANAKWTEWYREWKTTRGFGGASGNGLDGEPPF
jgi:Ca2+/Na+ antiporter